VAAVAGLAAAAQSEVGQRALRTLGVAGSGARYTELAFIDPRRLPTSVSRTPTTLHLPFTITNREGTTRTYTWTMTASGPPAQLLRGGTLTVGNGEQADLDPSVRLACTRRTRITVSISTGQAIGLWATCVVQPAQNASVTGTPTQNRRLRAGSVGSPR
jgi:hypothetical protein